MARFLFFALLALAIYLLWRWVSVRGRADQAEPSAVVKREKQAMVSCAACGLHLPQPDALAHNGQHFCCEEHRARGPSDGQ